MTFKSKVYIAVSDDEVNLTEDMIDEISVTVEEKFGDSSCIVSKVSEGGSVEVVYGIQVPMLNESIEHKEFFEKLMEIIIEYEDFNPHFTHIEEGDFDE